mgnify:CR=1 FL=1
MTDATSSPDLKPSQRYKLAILDSKAVLSLIAFLTGLGTMWGAQQFTASPKPLRIPAADSIPIPAPVVSIDVAPIVKAIEGIRADFALERANRHLKVRPLK